MNRRRSVLFTLGWGFAALLTGCGGGGEDGLSSVPDEGWGLLLGQFSQPDDAARLATASRSKNYTNVLVLTVFDNRGLSWTCVVLGPFAESWEARNLRAAVARDFGWVPESLPIVQLPLVLGATAGGAGTHPEGLV